MSHFDKRRREKGKSLKSLNEEIAQSCATKKTLKRPAGLQAPEKMLFPFFRVKALQLFSVDFCRQKQVNQFGSEFARVKGYAHTISAEWCDHACCIAQHQHMVFHLRFLTEADL